ncbi:malate synthase G [Novosphingobium sp. RL4]|uniref:malate synthase G n=1 Tax=Novosphingobium sp. RL4 TaxID=3109595 RepID=UPI002D796A6E|nr:malate synthase G [Novosphingobium sp. RL4]WRT95328.1 malate synthase G [Novosphingobium sp. RL4]
MATQTIDRAGLSVESSLAAFIEEQALPGTAIAPEAFWHDLAVIFARFTPRNAALLATRDRLQARIDAWHRTHRDQPFDAAAYQAFLSEIGYLAAEPAPFRIAPENVDPELAAIAGPQLVVPVLNARFLLNAANARWGSLYDALYGTDALPGKATGPGYDPERGAEAIAWSRAFLDRAVPLSNGSWADFAGGDPALADPAAFAGRRGANILLRHHGLHIEIVIDPAHPIGAADPAGIADIQLEAAITTIVDLEDSVAAVDGPDKRDGYANWLGLMQGDLEATFEKGGKSVRRHLSPDRAYTAPDGSPFSLRGRSLLLVRNVGHLMRTPAVHLPDGSEAFEGILDAVVTSLIALHDLDGRGRYRNSPAGSIYIVKPKMHGPDEAAFANDLFDAVEDMLGLARHTIKIGVMDEERRTSANLAACIHAVKDRIVFINTGFLDRTGDEIHTSMQAGPMQPKGDMKSARWLVTYENRNVQIGLQTGFSGRAQIGKGMWAAPDRMADMLEQKIAHPLSGASTAWVPSPTAAVLHATHYHAVDVATRQSERAAEPPASLGDLLTLPLGRPTDWNRTAIERELDNNAQGILGYVVRWIDQGIGCSKVPDINDVGLMEDRATLRISAQALGNWLLHGVCTQDDVEAALARMAEKVDAQNAADPDYSPMSRDRERSVAFQTARALIFEAAAQPNGYTECLLHRFRLQRKCAA